MALIVEPRAVVGYGNNQRVLSQLLLLISMSRCVPKLPLRVHLPFLCRKLPMTGMTLKTGSDCGSRPPRTTTTSSFNNNMCIIAISTRSRLRVGSHSKMKDFPDIDSLYQMAGCHIMQEPFPNRHILSGKRLHPIWYPCIN